MPNELHDHDPNQVVLIPTSQIRILNPRVRNRRNFEEMVENIARIGLKRPITLAERAGTDPIEYDLVCGQGRLEAFVQLKQEVIPGHRCRCRRKRVPGHEPGRNCARRQHRPIDLMREISTLRKRGYDDRQFGNKIGVTAEYVSMIAGRLERGEERLVSAVETGLLPLNLAIEISKTDAEGAQQALMDAIQKKLRGKAHRGAPPHPTTRCSGPAPQIQSLWMQGRRQASPSPATPLSMLTSRRRTAGNCLSRSQS